MRGYPDNGRNIIYITQKLLNVSLKIMLHASLERVMKTRGEIRTSLFSAVSD